MDRRRANERDRQDSNLKIGNAVEIVGKVNPDFTVKVLTSTDFGENLGRCCPPGGGVVVVVMVVEEGANMGAGGIDMKVYEDLVGICQQYKEIFYDS